MTVRRCNLNEKLATYTAALNAYDLDAVETMFSEDAVYVSPGLGGEIHGRGPIMFAFRSYFSEHAEQENGDENIAILGSNTIQSDWWIKSPQAKSTGSQTIEFNEQGLIKSIVVFYATKTAPDHI